MENNKLLYIIIIGLMLGCKTTFAATSPTSTQLQYPVVASPIQPQVVEVENCNKIFRTDRQKLFYLTLSSINANRFTINEIQSKTGYIIFSVGQKQFLANVITINTQTALLKISPCDNNYYFPIGIIQNIFKHIELNISLPIQKLIVQ